ncbi:MAG: hypothetical protein CMF39_00800 [Legionellaceae bacterium]|nr:hypothetical protein [Legionellaceae bacterium]
MRKKMISIFALLFPVVLLAGCASVYQPQPNQPKATFGIKDEAFFSNTNGVEIFDNPIDCTGMRFLSRTMAFTGRPVTIDANKLTTIIVNHLTMDEGAVFTVSFYPKPNRHYSLVMIDTPVENKANLFEDSLAIYDGNKYVPIVKRNFVEGFISGSCHLDEKTMKKLLALKRQS